MTSSIVEFICALSSESECCANGGWVLGSVGRAVFYGPHREVNSRAHHICFVSQSVLAIDFHQSECADPQEGNVCPAKIYYYTEPLEVLF